MCGYCGADRAQQEEGVGDHEDEEGPGGVQHPARVHAVQPEEEAAGNAGH